MQTVIFHAAAADLIVRRRFFTRRHQTSARLGRMLNIEFEPRTHSRRTPEIATRYVNRILEVRPRHQHAMKLRQAVERHARVEVMLDVVVDVLRRDKDVLEDGRAGGPRLRIRVGAALDRGMLGDAADAEDHRHPGEQRHEPIHQQQVKRAEPCQQHQHRGVKAVARDQEPAADASVPREQHQRQLEIVDRAEPGQVAQHQEREPAPVLGKDPGRVALAPGPIGILAGIQKTMMREVVLAVRSRRDEIGPRQDYFGGPIVEPAAAEQAVVDAVVHQDQQRMLPRSDERDGQQVQREVEVALA